MKRLKLFLFSIPLTFILSCDSANFILQTWRFGSAFVDGAGTIAMGTITFSEENNGFMDIWYLIGADTVVKQGNFSYAPTEEELLIGLGSENFLWERRVNRRNEQEFHFEETIDQTVYKVVFDMIPE